MSYSIIDVSYMCRVKRATLAYKTPKDLSSSSSYIIQAGAMFETDHMIQIGKVHYYQIDEAVSNIDDSVLTYWCSENMLEMVPIEQEEESSSDENDITSVKTTLYIKGEDIKVYSEFNSTSPMKNYLSLTDTIVCDQKVKVLVNGTMETRYRISSVNNKEEDDVVNEVIGHWITYNSAVRIMTVRPRMFAALSNSFTFVSVTPNTAVTDYVNQVNSYYANGATERHVTNGGATNTQDSAIGTNSGSGSTPSAAVDTTAVDGTASDTADGDTEFDSSEIENTTAQEIKDSIQKYDIMDEDLYIQYGINYTYGRTRNLMSVPIGRMNFVHGMPFQYNYITDRRNVSENVQYNAYGKIEEPEKGLEIGYADLYGRVFAKEIVANMPIAVIVPGEPNFISEVKQTLLGYKENKFRNSFIPLFSNISGTQFEAAFNDLINSDSKDYDYFSFKVNTEEYFQYVNSLCQFSAKLMGLQDVKYQGTSCVDFDWYNYNQDATQDYGSFQEVLGLAGGVSVAFDPLSSISDTITNSTGESSMASFLNGLSSKARELQFVLGATTTTSLGVTSEDYTSALSSVGGTSVGSKFFATPFKRVSTYLKNSVSGVNIRFPEIWTDSSNSRSYDLDMKFVTPYATDFCKWRYVLVPFFHMFALAAPKSPDASMYYKRPFLIRAYSKGYFNVEMGIIESITWKRFGDGDMISNNGIPTEIDVSISFKDLYHTLGMSRLTPMLDNNNDSKDKENQSALDSINAFFNNTGLMDLIGTLSGVNMNRITLGERISMYLSAAGDVFSSTGSNFMHHLENRTRNIVEKYFVGI